MSSEAAQAQHGGEYRQFLPDLSIPRFTTMQKQDAHVYAKEFKEGGNPPWLHALYLHWLKLLKDPFKGITTDGNVRPDLFKLQDEEIPIDDIVTATNAVVALLDPAQAKRVKYHVDAPEWRTWSNPEFLLSDKGIRLDEISSELREKILLVLKTTLSPEGYQKALGATRVNGFLGDLVKSPAIMNEFSYNFVLFGEPSVTRPWGYAFYGHHLCLNIFFHKSQIVISPWFTGAEPNLIDEGKYKGTRILEEEEKLGLQLMQSLPADKQSKAQIYKQLRDPAMPHGRWNHDDQRHLCGAYRDNRIVPYEGILVSEMTPDQQELVLGILNQYLLYLPASARKLRLDNIKSWFHETYFSWIGDYGDADPFYYRIQSPVIIVEFDHHSGVFLTNKEPAKFHIHTLLRTPNAGDYGMALRPLIPSSEQAFTWDGERD
ncbi:hypothetical protein J7T55_014840 [Diaporthe amygdali]|uniref:uncharacterized protein n=1 Tax=Phomopsis amygdali TaxID=1214568 RepID=UPI0022FEF579|nr:uncharacterized protein J7T55_014840 [Diaporthe amygdali]KAJ0110037.1 hypothetical protein J7T55_014840 [Diaporthe amygdali]